MQGSEPALSDPSRPTPVRRFSAGPSFLFNLRVTLLPKPGGKCAEEFCRSRDPERVSLGNRLIEVVRVVGQEPVGFADASGQEYGDVCGVPDQVPARTDQSFVRICNNLGLGQINKSTIVFYQLHGFTRRQTYRMKYQVCC